MSLEQCWLPVRAVPESAGTPAELARWELEQAKINCALTVMDGMGDSYEILDGGRAIRGGETGVLYGAYRLLEFLRAFEEGLAERT